MTGDLEPWALRSAPWVVRGAVALKDRGLNDSEVARLVDVDAKSVARWWAMALERPPGWPDHAYDQLWRSTAARRARKAAWLRAYRKHRIVGGGPLTVDAIGARRRLQALMRLGHSTSAIATAGGWNCAGSVQQILRRDRVTVRTLQSVVAVYDALSMSPGTSLYARRYAERAGWAPPLAWDDIDDPDDPDETPQTAAPTAEEPLVDEVVVQRILAGQVVPVTYAEKVAVYNAWLAEGRTIRELERLTGWHTGRALRKNRIQQQREDLAS